MLMSTVHVLIYENRLESGTVLLGNMYKIHKILILHKTSCIATKSGPESPYQSVGVLKRSGGTVIAGRRGCLSNRICHFLRFALFSRVTSLGCPKKRPAEKAFVTSLLLPQEHKEEGPNHGGSFEFT